MADDDDDDDAACGRGIGFGVDDLLLAGGSNSFPDFRSQFAWPCLCVCVCVVVTDESEGCCFQLFGTPFCTDKRFCILCSWS
jgi:hypothetical protein